MAKAKKLKVQRPHQAFDLEEVIWDDATALPAGWSDEVPEPEPALVLSVGFVVNETDEHLVLALDVDASGNHNGRSQIPKGMVKQRKVLRRADGSA